MKSTQTVSLRRRFVVGKHLLNRFLVVSAVSALSLTAATAAIAETTRPAHEYRQGQIYHRAPGVAADLAQVVFFRAGSPSSLSSGNGAAHVYLNGQLEAALMPNGFTRFCVKKGTYSIEAYIGDAPLYSGKADPGTEVNLEGGATYYLGVSEGGSGEPVPYRRADAERLLKTSAEQIHIINRAAAVVPCTAAEAPLQFTLDAAVLFDFAQSNPSSITTDGHDELKKIAGRILALPHNGVARVAVVGHADPIGSRSFNLDLSEQRAQTAGDLLARYGIPARLIRTTGMGSAKPVVNCPSAGDRAERISCNAPNRRVEINVERSTQQDTGA